jgi:hypothetical protein
MTDLGIGFKVCQLYIGCSSSDSRMLPLPNRRSTVSKSHVIIEGARYNILPNVVGCMTAKRKVAGSNLVTDDFQTRNPIYLQLWALWVPGEES